MVRDELQERLGGSGARVVTGGEQPRPLDGEDAAELQEGVEVIGVFTSPSVWLSNASGTSCYTKDEALKVLRGDAFLRDGGLDPKELEAVLQPRIIRANSKEEKDRIAVEK